ncbi:Uncharacterised protein [Serratia quinivorans]|nr:Uncharacterised protein [Serratia quinivorans]
MGMDEAVILNKSILKTMWNNELIALNVQDFINLKNFRLYA